MTVVLVKFYTTFTTLAFKEAGDILGLNINTHSMRKSRGMAMYSDGVPIEKNAKALNHSNTTSTLRYLGITKEEALKTDDDYELWIAVGHSADT